MRFLFAAHVQSILDLLFVHPVQILQQHLSISFFPLVFTHVVAPAAYCAGQATRYVWLLADIGDGMEVRADGEDYAPGSRESVDQVRIVLGGNAQKRG
jgi:hypothetical protein